ncbi:hypothetical protein [Blastococcus sp. CT_GayMR19]|nr:hypothetical protein [Blastococcus sp. CT_GayMR19]
MIERRGRAVPRAQVSPGSIPRDERMNIAVPSWPVRLPWPTVGR